MVSEVFDELQSSLAAVTAKDSVALRALTDTSSSAVSHLLDTLKDALHSSRTELSIALNTFKADAMEEQQRVGMRLQQEDARLTVGMGAWKTGTENVKLRAIFLFSVVLCVACVLVGAQAPKKKQKKPARTDTTEEFTL